VRAALAHSIAGLGRYIAERSFVEESTPALFVAACKAYFLDLPMAMTSETLRFMGHRLEEQAKLLSSLSTCHTL
jgi:hypothetical protein